MMLTLNSLPVSNSSDSSWYAIHQNLGLAYTKHILGLAKYIPGGVNENKVRTTYQNNSHQTTGCIIFNGFNKTKIQTKCRHSIVLFQLATHATALMQHV